MQTEYTKILTQFANHFTPATWAHVQVLLIGAILARGQRTVTAVLRVMGLSGEKHFVNYHRVLNRAVWSARGVSHSLLHLLLQSFGLTGPLVVGGDDTIERRRGAQIMARGIYRDPVRSSQGHLVTVSGLRWLSLMLLVPIPFAGRTWALPFLTVLAPAARAQTTRQRAPKKLTDWTRQALLQVRRWLPAREVVFVGDGGFAVIDLLARMRRLAQPITMVVRARLDAALYAPPPARHAHQRGKTPQKGARRPTLAAVEQDPQTRWTAQVAPRWYGETQRAIEYTSQTAIWYHNGKPPVPVRWVLVRDPRGRFRTAALFCTALEVEPWQIIQWFIQRWQLEVTWREVREHLGVETQRQWSELAIARTTPALLGLYALVSVFAHRLALRGRTLVRPAAWYTKTLPTFSDALAAVRAELWRCPQWHTSHANHDIAQLPMAIFQCLMPALTG